MTDRSYRDRSGMSDEWWDEFEADQEALREITTKLDLNYRPHNFQSILQDAKRSYFPSEHTRRESIYWPSFYDHWKPHWTSEQYDIWSEAYDVMVADQRDRAARKKAKAAAKAAEQAAAEQADNERRQKDLEELTARLRRQYLEVPGTTEATFQAMLPRLIEDEQLRMMREQDTEDERARRAHAAAFRF